MKQTKRIIAICLVAIMALMMFPMAVSAAEHLDTTQKVSFTVNCSKEGYEFTVYKVGTLDTTYVSPYETKYTSLVPAINDAVLNGDTNAMLAALDAVTTMPATATVVGTYNSTDAGTKAFTDLDQGIYYIKATNYPAGVKSVTNSGVALPYYNDDNNNWVYSVTNIDLATKVVDGDVTTEKIISEVTDGGINATDNTHTTQYADASLGDVITFDITSSVAGSTSMKLGSYVVYDNMSAGLTLDKNSFEVYLVKANGTKTQLAASDYVVTYTSEGTNKPTVFNVALTNEYLQKNDFYAADVVSTLVRYNATLNEYAVVGVEGNPNEEVKLSYSNKNGVTSEVAGNTVYVYTYQITADKFDEKDSPLQGSEFALYDTEANAKAMTNPIATATSDANGFVEFKTADGKAIKLQKGTYYAVETKAPEGYNVYGNVITIDLTAEYGDTFVDGTWVTAAPENGTVHFEVHNTRYIHLVTGGEGRSTMYIIGLSVVFVGAAVAVTYVVSKKRKATN